MRKIFFVVLMLIAGAASAAELREKFDQTYEVRPGSAVSLTNINGRITISAWDQPRIQVHAEKYVDGFDADAAKKAMAAMRVEVKQTPGGLAIETRQPRTGGDGGGFLDWLVGDHVNAGVTYELKIPRSMNLSVENTNGAIHVAEVSGKLDVGTTNGRIELTRCSGSVNAETTNGAIRVDLVQVTPNAAMRFETTNGGITLSVPPSISASVDAGTTNGSVSSDVPITTTSSSSGRHSLRGTMNGGGPSIRLNTTNGSIKIVSAAASK